MVKSIDFINYKVHSNIVLTSSRTNERGATMLIVLMVLLLLSAIGILALNNARFEVQTAGFVRQQAMAQQMSEYGAYASMQEIESSPAAYFSRIRVSGSSDSTTKEICVANANLTFGDQLPPCYHIYPADIKNRSKFTGELVEAPLSGKPGSLGLRDLNGGFIVELTDPLEVSRPIAGNPIDGSAGTPKFIDTTLSATGVVFSDFFGGLRNGIVDDAERASTTFVNGRGHLLIGPLYGSL